DDLDVVAVRHAHGHLGRAVGAERAHRGRGRRGRVAAADRAVGAAAALRGADGDRGDVHGHRHPRRVHGAVLHRAERADDARRGHGGLLPVLQPAPAGRGDRRDRVRDRGGHRGVVRVGEPAGGARRGADLMAVAVRVLGGIALVLLGVFIIGPLAWLAVRAFATGWTYPNLLPDGWTLHWFGQVFADPLLFSSIQLSLAFAFTTIAVSAVICLPAAYAFARFDFPGRRFFLIGLFA